MLEILNKWQRSLAATADKRISTNWFLMSLLPFITSLLIYLAIVKIVLPKYMENRKPFKLNNVLIGYNACQVAVNVYLVYISAKIWYGMSTNSLWRCSPVDKSNSLLGQQSINVLYLYFLSKYTDFFDTFFFILRKKNNQASFLHVYHHVSTPIITWIAIRLYPGGTFILFVMLNAFVHSVMYTYYMLAAFGPQIQKYLWWKKYITTIQLLQFTIGIIHSVLLLLTPECNISAPMIVLCMLDAFLFVWLFGKFYTTSYIQKKGNSKGLNKIRCGSVTITAEATDNIRKCILT